MLGCIKKSKFQMSKQSPCSKQHALSLIPQCVECQRLLIRQSDVPMSRELLDAAVRTGFLDRINDGVNQYFYIEEIRGLQQLPEKEQSKILVADEKLVVIKAHDLCQHCHKTTGLYRKCTQNYLCDECRKTPDHKILSEIQVFRQFPGLCYNDIIEGIQRGVVRDLVDISSSKAIITKYFYEQDILQLVQSM